MQRHNRRCTSMQTSAFGAWLDVAVDNTSRAVLYAWTLPGPAAAFPIALEFLTFVATHKVRNSRPVFGTTEGL